MKYLAILLLAFTVSVTSCKKKEDDPEPSKKEMVSKTWRPKEVYINGQLSSDQIWNSWRFEFKENGTFISTTSAGSSSGVWEFNSDESKIILDKGSAAEETWDIITLNSAALKVKYTEGTDNAEILWEPS